MKLARYLLNPILRASDKWWEGKATFNPCVIKDGGFHMLYRACSNSLQTEKGVVSISSIGHAVSRDGVKFEKREFFFGPEYPYEAFGCEDPRITKFEGEHFIFYTAVSDWPPKPEAVKVALATTKDFEDYEKYGIITPFNAKAMALFPKRIGGSIFALLTFHPDIPPSRVIVAEFESIDQLIYGGKDYWKIALEQIEKMTLMKAIPPQQFVEVGAPPIETKEGWLLIYPEITPELYFHISAMLLDRDDPLKIIAKAKEPLLSPEVAYELESAVVPGVAFPSGAVIEKDKLLVYYGASDKYCCLATCDLDELLAYLLKS